MMNRNATNADLAAAPQQRAGQSQPYVVQHEFGGSAELTTTLAHAISDVTGIDVTDTGFTLAEYVDPDALDRLFQPKSDGTVRTNGYLCFDVWGCQVTVYSTGQIVITPPRNQPTQQPPAPNR